MTGLAGGSANDETGTWGYRSGTGTATIVVTGRCVGITATASSSSPGTMIVNGGNTITIPVSSAVDWTPRGVLINPTIVFDTTAGYIVEFLT